MTNNFNCWHVLYVKSRHEKKVHEMCLESSLESFLPMVENEIQWSDRKKIMLKPLFPTYVFVKVTSSVDFYKALDFSGVFKFIRFGKEYAKIKEEEINKIKAVLEFNDVSEIKTNTHFPRIGDSKKISRGKLSGFDCEVLRVINESKVLVSIVINSLKQNITAIIPSYYLSDSFKTI